MNNKIDFFKAAGQKIFLFLIALIFVSCDFFSTGYEENTKNKKDDEEEIIVHNSAYYEKFLELNTGLPLLVINTVNNEAITSKEDYVNASFDLIEEGRSDVVFGEGLVSIKGRGNSSWSSWQNFPKKPYTVKLPEKTKLLGLPKHKKWVLVANYSDYSLLRNTFASYAGKNVFTKMSWAPSMQNIDLILNGTYVGNYTLGEQIRINKKRVNIQSFLDTDLGEGEDLNKDGIVDINDGGFILEIENRDTENSIYKSKNGNGCSFELKDPGEDDFSSWTEKHYNYIKNIVDNAENAVCSRKNWRNFIDVPSFIDWYLANEFFLNTDSLSWQTSAYMYYDPADKKLHMGPDWDFDIAMGNYSGVNTDPESWNSYTHYGSNGYVTHWYDYLFQDTTFKNELIERWKEISDEMENSIEKIDEMAEKNKISAEKDLEKWPARKTETIWPNPSSFTSYENEVSNLKNWLSKRRVWMDKNISSIGRSLH